MVCKCEVRHAGHETNTGLVVWKHELMFAERCVMRSGMLDHSDGGKTCHVAWNFIQTKKMWGQKIRTDWKKRQTRYGMGTRWKTCHAGQEDRNRILKLEGMPCKMKPQQGIQTRKTRSRTDSD